MDLHRDFYLPPNELSLDEVEGGRWASPLAGVLAKWVGHARRSEEFPHLLAMRTAGKTELWAFGRSARETRELGACFAAFLGPGELATSLPLPVSDQDPAGRRLVASGVREALHWEVQHEKRTALAIGRVVELLRCRPKSRRRGLATTGRILRDLELALEFGPVDAASRLFDLLEVEARLDSFNLGCLRVRLLHAQARWTEIVRMPGVGAVLRAPRRPAAVTNAVADAFYRAGVQPLEGTDDVWGALARLDSCSDEGNWGDLVRMGPRPASSEVYVALRALWEVKNRSQVTSLGLLPAHLAGLPLYRAIRGRGPASESEIGKANVTTPNLVATMLQRIVGAIHAGEATMARETLDGIESLEGFQRAELLESEAVRVLVSQVRDLADGGSQGWLPWLRSLPTASAPKASAALGEGSALWTEEVARDPELAPAVAEAMTELQADASIVFEACLPGVLAAFLPADGAIRGTTPVLLALLERIACQTGSMAMLGATFDLVLALLSLGLEPSEYRDTLDAIQLVWGDVESFETLGWLVDVVDMLAVYPCKDIAAREAVFWSAVATYERFQHRPDGRTFFVGLSLVSRDLGLMEALADSLPDEVSDVETPDLAGKVVGVYTLMDSLAGHLESRLKQRYPGVQVRFDHSKVGTERLRHLAKVADVFVMVTRAAKHAATEVISSVRRDGEIVYPDGKGMSSILRAIEAHLAEQVGT